MTEWFTEASYLEVLAACLAACLACTVIGLAWGYAGEHFAFKRGRKVFDVKLKRGQLRHETIGTALFHLVFAPALALLLHSGAVAWGSGWLAQVLGFALPWIVFQIFYYAFHRAAHTRALFWMHRWHHESLVTTPMTGLSMSPFEAAIWTLGMLVPALALSPLGIIGFGGFAYFLAMHWIGNIAGHANAEIFPLRASKLSSLTLMNPISYHSLHHARFDGHYGFAAAYMDRLFGTEWSDWLEVHERVMDGQPMKKLTEGQRGPAKAA